MENLFLEQVSILNWTINLISCVSCIGFFYAYFKTPRKPIPLKMIFVLIISSAANSLLRLLAPYFVGSETSCKVAFSIFILLFNFPLFWGTAMSILAARSITQGFQALTSRFFKLSLVLSILGAVTLTTIPTWIPSSLVITYAAGTETCSLVLVDPINQLSGKIAVFFYSLSAEAVLLTVTVFCFGVVFVSLTKSRKSVLPLSFLTNISRIMWYPLALVLIHSLTVTVCILHAYFQIEVNVLNFLQETVISLAGFLICSVYAAQRLLIYNEERKMEGSEIFSVSVSEKFDDKNDRGNNQILLMSPSDTDY